MTRIFIIRHGKTDWNIQNRTQGHSDIPLNDEGRHQALLASKRLSREGISHIYSSDLIRARETADIISKELGIEVEPMPSIREMNFGRWEGLTLDQIKQKYNDEYTVWRATPHICSIVDGEPLIEVQQRGIEAIKEIINRHPGEKIALVSHGTAIKAIILGMLGLDLSNFNKIKQDNTGINIIEYRNYGPVLVELNCTSHLMEQFNQGI